MSLGARPRRRLARAVVTTGSGPAALGAAAVLLIVAHAGAALGAFDVLDAERAWRRGEEAAARATESGCRFALEHPRPRAHSVWGAAALQGLPRWEAWGYLTDERRPEDHRLLFRVEEHPVIGRDEGVWMVPDAGAGGRLPSGTGEAWLSGSYVIRRGAGIGAPGPTRHVSWRRVHRPPFIGEIHHVLLTPWGGALTRFEVTYAGLDAVRIILAAWGMASFRAPLPGEWSRRCGPDITRRLHERQGRLPEVATDLDVAERIRLAF